MICSKREKDFRDFLTVTEKYHLVHYYITRKCMYHKDTAYLKTDINVLFGLDHSPLDFIKELQILYLFSTSTKFQSFLSLQTRLYMSTFLPSVSLKMNVYKKMCKKKVLRIKMFNFHNNKRA